MRKTVANTQSRTIPFRGPIKRNDKGSQHPEGVHSDETLKFPPSGKGNQLSWQDHPGNYSLPTYYQHSAYPLYLPNITTEQKSSVNNLETRRSVA